MRGGVDVEDVSLSGDELCGQEVVGGEPVLRHQPPEPAAEGVTGDPCAGNGAAGDGQPVLGGGFVELSPDDTALGSRGRAIRIDRNPLHLAEIDHQPAVRDGAPGDVVTATADRDFESLAARERQSRNDVVRRSAAHDQRGPAIDEAVVHRSRDVIACVSRLENRSRDLSAERWHERRVQGDRHRMPFRK